MMCFNLCNSLPETLFFRDKVSLRVSMIFEEKNPKYKILIFFFFYWFAIYWFSKY